MKKRNRKVSALATTVAVAALASAGNAAAFIVLDPANLAVNGMDMMANKASLVANTGNMLTNVASTALTGLIMGNMAHMDDRSNEHFDITEIHQNTVENNWNKWENNYITNTYTDHHIVLPPEREGNIDAASLQNEVAGAKQLDMYGTMDSYTDKTPELTVAGHREKSTDTVFAANASLQDELQKQASAMDDQYAYTGKLADGLKKPEVESSRNAQLQYANAIGLENTRQLMRTRSLMLRTENANNARAQLETDRQAREFANGNKLAAASSLEQASPNASNW